MTTIPWSEETFADDIYKTLLQRERQVTVYKALSTQLQRRRVLVDWLAVVCEDLAVGTEAKHLTVHLLDYFMDCYEINPSRIHLIVLGCLLVACKFEETENNIPRWHQVDKFIVNSEYEADHYLQTELLLLQHFKWNVCIPTASHFTWFFMNASLQHEKEIRGNIERIAVYHEKYVEYFLEVSLQDHNYRFYPPSLVGLACVAASRACMQLAPIWPDHLSQESPYTWDQVVVLFNSMLASFMIDDKTTKEQAKTSQQRLHDSGYSSTDCSTSSPLPYRSVCEDDSEVDYNNNISHDSQCTSGGSTRSASLPSSQYSTPSPTQRQLVSNLQDEMVLS